jgi:RNA-binding protein YlmH
MNYKDICKHLSANDDEYIFLSGVCDRINTRREKNILTATKFLDARQLALTKQFLLHIGCQNYVLDGRANGAERQICIFMPDYPVSLDLFEFIRATKSKQDTLAHRDYLGSLMGLQLKRECIGDIFVHEDGADIVVLREIADFLMLEYNKAGRKSLSLEIISRDEVKTDSDSFTIITTTVSSMRLDAIAGDVFRISRSASAELIKKGKLLLNSAECLKPDKLLDIGDKITVRGKGRAEIMAIQGKSKKGRIIVEIKKFWGVIVNFNKMPALSGHGLIDNFKIKEFQNEPI